MNKHTVVEQVSSLREMEQRLRQILEVVGNVLLHVVNAALPCTDDAVCALWRRSAV